MSFTELPGDTQTLKDTRSEFQSQLNGFISILQSIISKLLIIIAMLLTLYVLGLYYTHYMSDHI